MSNLDDFVDRLNSARAGDRLALSTLFQRAMNGLEHAARAMLGTGLRAKMRTSDLVQSALLEGLRNLQDFKGSSEGEFARWLHRILENNLRDRDRYHHASRRSTERELPGLELRGMPGTATSPSETLAATERLMQMSEAISRLPEDYRKILLLCLTRDLSHEEAGRIMGRSAGASRVLLARARAALLVELEKTDGGKRG